MRRPFALIALLALAVLCALRAASAPPWPDDWDGIGFVEAVTRFDLDHFVPHPPGYPVYVALLRIAGAVMPTPIEAANLVAVGSGIAAAVFLTLAAGRALDPSLGAWLGAFVALSPLVWRASTAIGSEAPALAFLCAACFGATRSPRAAPWWIGIAIGLGLGVRLSWAPLFLPLLVLAPRRRRLQCAGFACVATLAWSVPFVAIVGSSHLAVLARAQATGHFEVWGGSAISEPGGARRLLWLARDLFVDGLGADRDPLGAAISLAVAALGVLGLRAWRARGWLHARLLVLPLPYLLWITLGQNLHQQPRHTLPIVVALACTLGLAAATSVRAGFLGAALLALLLVRTGSDAYTRRTIPPPGAQLVAFAHAEPGSVYVYGGPSARFFELDGSGIGATVGSIGDVRLAVGRLRSLPGRVLVTSELDGLSSSAYPIVPVATFCRPPRVERRAPCLDVFEWRAPFLRR